MQAPRPVGMWFVALALSGVLAAENLMAIEEPQYRVVHADGPIEIRDYGEIVVAETVVDTEFEDAGSQAFNDLFRYISDNDISMTAPVNQTSTANGWAVQFVMPASYDLESLPRPDAPGVVTKSVPPQRVAVIQYSGSWSAENYASHLDELKGWLAMNGYQPAGEAVWARYNAPYSLWFLRRNEIHLPLSVN